MSLEEVRAKAQQFQKRIRRRNIREYSAMVLALVMAIPLAVFFRSFPLIVVAMGLIIAGTLFIAYQFRKRMSTRSFLAEAASMSCLEFYRRELERQRDANLRIWSWYILPMLPGTAMMLIEWHSCPLSVQAWHCFMRSLSPLPSSLPGSRTKGAHGDYSRRSMNYGVNGLEAWSCSERDDVSVVVIVQTFSASAILRM